tara:strand:- start:141 stop:1223 length:1083 start_codon:yes stop_codon:yes gene_type:complete
MYEYIVIGGGIVGLYFALTHPERTLVLEKNDRLGGRAISIPFSGVSILPGAGIGIADKDHILLKLMKDLGYKYTTFWLDVTSIECQNILKKLYDNINLITSGMTFLDYMNTVLTKDEITVFQKENSYTDYQSANALITMLHYGLEDNCSRYLGISILWSKLIAMMSAKCNYITSQEVLKIDGKSPYFEVVTQNHVYNASKVIIATTISGVRKLLADPIYNKVKAHPFMRVYASFNDKDAKIMNAYFPKTTRTYNKLHFIIPMSDTVWMIAYTDGQDAISLHEKMNKTLMESYLSDMTEHKIHIDDMKVFYWNEGSHYYLPGDIDFEHIRRPEEGIYVVGEAVARRQGWCNGGLETIHEIM